MLKKINEAHEIGDSIVVAMFGQEIKVNVVANIAFHPTMSPSPVRYEAAGFQPNTDIQKLLQKIGKDIMPFSLQEGMKSMDELRAAVAAEIAKSEA